VADPDTGTPPARVPTKADLKRFRAAMDQATRAAKKGDHAAAMAAYDRALAIKPDDQGALTDQGWSAFQLRLYDRAEALSRRAISVGGTERREAAAQYNLGRILEARGNRAGAAAAYLASLQARPTRTVREQLASIDPAAAADADPLKPIEMQGPFARLFDFCQSRKEKDSEECPFPARGGRIENLNSPYRDVVWIQAGERGPCFVAFKLARGWFVDAKGWDCVSDAELQSELTAFESADLVPGGAREVVVRTNLQTMDLFTDKEEFVKSYAKACESRMVACGVPVKSGTPKCLYMQVAKLNSLCQKADGTEEGWELRPVFSADGQVDVQATGKPDEDARVLVGRRPLAFP
jgi:tetratricopeptide (TPR) repeat protein